MPGDHSESEPPLPIPNRTVKRLCADDSADYPCESRSSPGSYAPKPPAHKLGVLLLWRAQIDRRPPWLQRTLRTAIAAISRLSCALVAARPTAAEAARLVSPLNSSRRKIKSSQNARIFYCCRLRNKTRPLTVLPVQNTVSPVRTLAGSRPAIAHDMPCSGLESNYFTALQANFADPDSSASWYDVVQLAACLLNCFACSLPNCCIAAEV